MAEISNKTLAVLLITAIVVSVGGAMINIAKLTELTRTVPLLSIIGMATTVGTVNVTISSNVEINLTTYEIDFGPGYVYAGTGDAARLNTSSGSLGKENWTSGAGYTYLPNNITIENTGNRNCSVNFTSDKAAAEFIGGGVGAITDPVFQFRGVNKDAGTCSSTNLTSSYTAVTASVDGIPLCECMRFEDGNDELYFNVQVLVPQDAPVGGKNSTLTFTGSDWSATDKSC